VPTPIELTCADPNAPCKLPNNFLADPALKPVIARTLETGARGTLGSAGDGNRTGTGTGIGVALGWSVAVFRTELTDDIQFISAGGAAVNAGYFQNVGKTRRQGLEMSATTRAGNWSVTGRAAWLDATFRSAFAANSPANSSADANGAIRVAPGNRIPGIPRNTLKLRGAYDAGQRWSAGLNLVWTGPTFARGDENNQDINGRVPGWTVVNLDGTFHVTGALEIYGRLNNVFDRTYATLGVLGENFFQGPGNTFDGTNPVNEQFRGLGTPRALWVGVRYRIP
jgi:outer membrane receptor protein involved in Fe transport